MDDKGTIVSYGGGFKPPHKGHFNVIKRMIEKYPDAEAGFNEVADCSPSKSFYSELLFNNVDG